MHAVTPSMRMPRIYQAGLAVLIFMLDATTHVAAQPATADNWPQFRGPAASGVGSGSPPAEWDVENNKNVLWKTPVAGLAHSSPIVWGDRVFVTTAVSAGESPELKVGLYGAGDSAKDMVEHEFKLICLDRNSGKVLWDQTAYKGIPKVRRHTKATHCNSTPATDGQYVVAFFGSEGLYCYSMNGKLLWQKDLGVLDAGPYDAQNMQWGFASSPILVSDRVIVQCDVYKSPFLAAFHARDGREIWRTPREDVCTWSTPAVYENAGRRTIAANGFKQIAGFDFETGKQVWRLTERGGDVPVPTPIVSDGLLYIANAHGNRSPIFALKTNLKGEFGLPKEGESSDAIAWWIERVGVYMQTLLSHQGILYACRDNGVLYAFDAKTGKQHYKERVGQGNAGFTASIVAAGDKLYVTNEEGDVYVLKTGPAFERMGRNPLGETCLASPAISHGALFFRTRNHVVAIGQTAQSCKPYE